MTLSQRMTKILKICQPGSADMLCGRPPSYSHTANTYFHGWRKHCTRDIIYGQAYIRHFLQGFDVRLTLSSENWCTVTLLVVASFGFFCAFRVRVRSSCAGERRTDR